MTTFHNQYSTTSTLLSSSISSVRATTDLDLIEASLTIGSGTSETIIFSTTLSAFNNVVELFDVGSLIEEYFRREELSCATVNCRFGDALLSLRVQYCEAELPEQFDPANAFLTAATTQTIHRNSVINLAHGGSGDKYVFRFVGFDHLGGLKAVEREIMSRTLGQNYISFQVDWLLEQALTGYQSLSRVAFFSVAKGKARQLYYLADDPFYLTFQFHNIFNIPEYVDVVATVKQSTKVSRETAVCSGTAIPYDRKTSRTYEVNTGSLTADDAAMVTQLITSHSAKLACRDGLHDIIITDHTVEQDDNDAKLCSFKFTFRFASERIRLTDREIQALCPVDSRIFTDEFSLEFS